MAKIQYDQDYCLNDGTFGDPKCKHNDGSSIRDSKQDKFGEVIRVQRVCERCGKILGWQELYYHNSDDEIDDLKNKLRRSKLEIKDLKNKVKQLEDWKNHTCILAKCEKRQELRII